MAKKIMFSDKYGLTKAVLDGRKTQTRRIVPDKLLNEYGHNKFSDKSYELIRNSPYKVGEEIAVAQNYQKVFDAFGTMIVPQLRQIPFNHKGWHNKMFVKPELMPYRIKITNVRIERLQDISDEDCLAEGIEKLYYAAGGFWAYKVNGEKTLYRTPREAYAYLIDKVSGKGTWDSNPWVFVYDFKLVKLD